MADEVLLDVASAATMADTSVANLYAAIARRALKPAKRRPILVVRLTDLIAWNAKRLANPRRGGRPHVVRVGVIQADLIKETK